MYSEKFKKHLQDELQQIKEDGLYKEERIITSVQGAEIEISTGQKVLNFCANNYLGLSSHPEVVQAAKDTLDSRRSEEHTSELQSRGHLVCRLLLEKKKTYG